MSVPAAASFTFNGQSFAANGYNVRVMNRRLKGSVPDLAQPRVNIQQLSGANGAVTQGATKEPIMIMLECVTAVRDTATLEEQITNIKTALDVTGEKSLILGWITGTRTVRQLNMLDFDRHQDGAFFTLVFIEPDPS